MSRTPRPRTRPPRRRRALVACLLGLAALGACSDDGDGAAGLQADDGTASPVLVFPAPSDVGAAVDAAGLELLAEEQLAVHYHATLEVVLDGRAVIVPANLGIASDGISELHTHDESGQIHIESATDKPFTLGQLLAEWGVPLTADCLGDRCVGEAGSITVTVDGTPHDGDANEIVFEDEQVVRIEVPGSTGA